MQYKCDKCYDTGSRDQIGTYLDCNECGVAQTRRDLNDFVKSLGPTHPEDVALAIHQRALAMAPKQEATSNKPVSWLCTDLDGHGDVGFTKEIAKQRAGYSCNYFYPLFDTAAPVAANGALPELPEDAAGSCEVITGHETIRGMQADIVEYQDAYSADQMRAYGKACAAAGPDAALIDERLAFETWIAAAFDECGEDEPSLTLDENGRYTSDMRVLTSWQVWQARAALSGAKGN